jgi:threonine/homoserine/homoserine lactone efflux protein
MLTSCLYGALLGLTSGFSPGPLLTLVVAQTLKHGIKEGAKVALAPLVTDAPIVTVCLLLLSSLVGLQWPLGLLSLVGAAFVGWMGWSGLRAPVSAARIDPDAAPAPRSLLKGALANALNPHPYLFWITVGAPATLKGWESSPAAAVGFLAGFFVCLIGAKLLVAVLVGGSRRFLEGRSYALLLRLLSAALLGFALVLVNDGLKMLGLIG